MNDEHLTRLIEAHLEGSLDETTHAELERLLLESESARRQFWEHAAVHGQLHEVAKLKWSSAREPLPQPRLVWRSLWTRVLRPVPLGFAAFFIGAVSGSLVYAHFSTPLSIAVPLANAGFESTITPGTNGFPEILGAWSGDLCRVTQADQGIIPREGAHMLRFLRPVAEGERSQEGFTVADQWLLLDVRTLPAMDESSAVVLSAFFNRSQDSTAANNRFGVALYAFKGSVADAPSLWHDVNSRALAFAESELPTDSDPRTWERGETRLQLPPDADLLIVRIHAFKQHWHDDATPDLLGHYADEVRLEIQSTTP